MDVAPVVLGSGKRYFGSVDAQHLLEGPRRRCPGRPGASPALSGAPLTESETRSNVDGGDEHRGRSSDGHASARLERCDAAHRQLEGSPACASVDGRLAAGPQCGQQGAHVPVESALELPRLVVEVAGLPHLARLVADGGDRQSADGVLDQQAAGPAVDLQLLGQGIGVGRVVRADEAADAPVGELERDGDGRVRAAVGPRHLRHHGDDRSAEVLDRVERVALRLDQLCVRVRPDVRLAAEPPAREDDVAEGARRDRGLGAEHRLGVAVVEVDGEEQIPLGRLAQELVRLAEVEHQRLLDEERHSGPDQLERRGEVVLVRQRDGDEVRLDGVEHGGDVGEAGGVRLRCLPACPVLVPADDRDDGRVEPLGEDPDVLPAPTAGADDGDAQGRAARGGIGAGQRHDLPRSSWGNSRLQ